MPTNATAMAWGRGVHSQLGIRIDADGEEIKPQPALQTVPAAAGTPVECGTLAGSPGERGTPYRA